MEQQVTAPGEVEPMWLRPSSRVNSTMAPKAQRWRRMDGRHANGRSQVLYYDLRTSHAFFVQYVMSQAMWRQVYVVAS